MFTEQRRGSLARMKDLVLTPKPVVEVTLTDDQKDAFVPQYTSLDEIKGEVSITASCDTSFSDLYITFEGSTRTFVEKIATTSPTNGRTEAFHNFVRLAQPMDPSAFPNPRVFEAGKIYKFPFTFVVPDTLLPQSCMHPKKAGFPEGGHLTPPPSLGDPLVASMGKSLMDDMAPEMGTIGTLCQNSLFLFQGFSLRIKSAREVFRHFDLGRLLQGSQELLLCLSEEVPVPQSGFRDLLPDSCLSVDGFSHPLCSAQKLYNVALRPQMATLTSNSSSSILGSRSSN